MSTTITAIEDIVLLEEDVPGALLGSKRSDKLKVPELKIRNACFENSETALPYLDMSRLLRNGCFP